MPLEAASRTGTAVDISRDWIRARSFRPVFSARPVSRTYWATTADIPVIWGAAMEVPE